MKKLFVVISLTFLLNNLVYGSDLPDEFYKFLSEKGLTKKINICKEEKKYSKKWYKYHLKIGSICSF